MKDYLLLLSRKLLAVSQSCQLLDLRIGLRYCAATVSCSTENRQKSPAGTAPVRACGLAASLLHELNGCCGNDHLLPRLTSGLNIEQVFEGLDSAHPLHRTVLLALCNALINLGRHYQESGNDSLLSRFTCLPAGWQSSGSDELPIEHKKVAMIGFFAPLVPTILEKATCLAVSAHEHGPAHTYAKQILPLLSLTELDAYETVILTATSLINNTFTQVITACPQATVVLMGPSAPLLPALFQPDLPQLTMIAGRHIVAIDPLLDIVSRTGGTPHFTPYTRKITFMQSSLSWAEAKNGE
ncbi:hypothetical protein JXQ70_20180 [bacterium]|nr:hypothetical protein [bacterium]